MSGLVLLHGFTGSPASWDAVLEALPAGPPVLRPTLLGHGPGAGAGVERFEQEVDRIADLVRSSRMEGAHLCGYSLGGRLALGLVVRHPALFASATVAGAHPGLTDPAERTARAAEDDSWALSLEQRGIEAFVASWERLPLFETQQRLPAQVRQAHRRRRAAHDPLGLARAMRVLGLGRMPPWSEGLRSAPVPLGLVVGEHDGKFRAVARELGAQLLQAGAVPPRVHVAEGAGHDVPLEAPRALAAVLEAGIPPLRATAVPSAARSGGLR